MRKAEQKEVDQKTSVLVVLLPLCLFSLQKAKGLLTAPVILNVLADIWHCSAPRLLH